MGIVHVKIEFSYFQNQQQSIMKLLKNMEEKINKLSKEGEQGDDEGPDVNTIVTQMASPDPRVRAQGNPMLCIDILGFPANSTEEVSQPIFVLNCYIWRNLSDFGHACTMS